jgi:hypothetical protein
MRLSEVSYALNCRVGKPSVLACVAQYELPLQYDSEGGVLLQENVGVLIAELGFDSTENLEVIVKYQTHISLLSKLQRQVVDNTILERSNLFLPVLRVVKEETIQYLARHKSMFKLWVEIYQEKDVADLIADGLLQIDKSAIHLGERITIVNKTGELTEREIVINDYQCEIGELEDKIAYSITVFPRGEVQFFISIVDSDAQFTSENYNTMIRNAIRTHKGDVVNRIRQYMIHNHGLKSVSDLRVVVQPFTLSSQDSLTVEVVYHPQDLVYWTDNEEIDSVILRVCHELRDRTGMHSSEMIKLQRILAKLLLYRKSCFEIRGFISADVISNGEVEGFHRHLQSYFGTESIFGMPPMQSEPDTAKGRLDLLIDNVPVELKLEDRKTFTSREIVESNEQQTAEYVANVHEKYGILVVLDIAVGRNQPASRLEDDVLLRQVQNISGNATPVVGVIIRMPDNRPSDLKVAPRGAKHKSKG